MSQPKIIAYLKPSCGWSRGVRAILNKYNYEFEDRDIINNPAQRMEMIQKSKQELSPCVEIDGHMLPDISGEEVEAWLLAKGYVTKDGTPVGVATDRGCSDEEHAAQAMGAAVANIRFIPRQ
ncbi:MAG: glutaredoxin [Blastochloris sp.]|jgi:monothiol glutaredoxin|nr:glutaredoxin [Blastochloris sp.]